MPWSWEEDVTTCPRIFGHEGAKGATWTATDRGLLG